MVFFLFQFIKMVKFVFPSFMSLVKTNMVMRKQKNVGFQFILLKLSC